MKNILLFLIALFCLFCNTHILHSQWTQTRGLSGSALFVSCLAVSDTNLFAGTDSGVFLSTNNGDSWSSVSNGLPQYVDVLALAISGRNLFIGTVSYGVFLSTNNGESWSAVDSGLTATNLPDGGTNVSGLAVKDSTVFITVNQDIGNSDFRSTNNGRSWSPLSGILKALGLSTASAYSFAISGANIFALCNNSRKYYTDGVFLSTDNGNTWSDFNLGLPYTTFRVPVVADTTLIVTDGGTGIYRTPIKSVGWVLANTGNSGLWIPQVYAFCFSDGNLYAGTAANWNAPSPGVFLSTNMGTSWRGVWNNDLPNNSVTSLAVSGPYLMAGTSGAGVWRKTLQEILDVRQSPSNLPTNFELDQNYPNPFNPSTTISFDLPSRSFVSLKVYDILGREVSTIVAEELQAGITRGNGMRNIFRAGYISID